MIILYIFSIILLINCFDYQARARVIAENELNAETKDPIPQPFSSQVLFIIDVGLSVNYFCGGVLISAVTILSAGGCSSMEMEPHKYNAYIGKTNITRETIKFVINEKTTHPLFNINRYLYNMGLLFLAEQQENWMIEAIPHKIVTSKTHLYVNGYGSSNNFVLPVTLTMKIMNVMKFKDCVIIYDNKKVYNKTLCVKPPSDNTDKFSFDYVDLGGPIYKLQNKSKVWQHKVVGFIQEYSEKGKNALLAYHTAYPETKRWIQDNKK